MGSSGHWAGTVRGGACGQRVIVQAAEILIQGGGAVGEDRVFRVEPASRKGKKIECSVQTWNTWESLLTTDPLQREQRKGWGGSREA